MIIQARDSSPRKSCTKTPMIRLIRKDFAMRFGISLFRSPCRGVDQGCMQRKHCYFWVTPSRLEPVIEMVRMIRNRIHWAMVYFTHRITDAIEEGLNSRISAIRKMSYGFRNKEHFRMGIYFRCVNLQLYPGTNTNAG